MFHVKDLQDMLLSGKKGQNINSSQYAICVNILKSIYIYIDPCIKISWRIGNYTKDIWSI